MKQWAPDHPKAKLMAQKRTAIVGAGAPIERNQLVARPIQGVHGKHDSPDTRSGQA